MSACDPAPSRLKHLACVLMLLAIVLRSAVPQGWMPVAGEDGGFGTYAICSANGVLPGAPDGDGAPGKQAPDTGTVHPPCAFAGMAALSPHAGTADVPAPSLVTFDVAIPVLLTHHGKRVTGAAAPRAPPARAGLA